MAKGAGVSTRTLVMAVPWEQQRTRRAITLAQEVGAEIVWDQHKDAFDTWKLLLGRAGTDAVIVLEDDVQLTDDWRTKVEAAISEHPSDVIQFFSMRGKDVTVGSRWEPGRTWIMNQCHYLPPGAAAELLDYARTWTRDLNGHDLCIADWLRSKRAGYWLHVPSLVQHEKWQSEIQPKRSSGRQSGTFLP